MLMDCNAVQFSDSLDNKLAFQLKLYKTFISIIVKIIPIFYNIKLYILNVFLLPDFRLSFESSI